MTSNSHGKGGWCTMDQYLSTVIIAVITGVFSVITLMIQKKQDKVITKIDEQTRFIEKEKELKRKLSQKEREKDELINKIMLLILDTNIFILKNTNISQDIPNVFALSEELKKQYDEISADIQNIKTEYEMVLNITSEFHREDDNHN